MIHYICIRYNDQENYRCRFYHHLKFLLFVWRAFPFQERFRFLNHELDCAKHSSFGFAKILNLQLECLIFTIILIFLKIVSIIILCYSWYCYQFYSIIIIGTTVNIYITFIIIITIIIILIIVIIIIIIMIIIIITVIDTTVI